MINITDKNYKSSIDEIIEYMDNSLFQELYEHLLNEYNALFEVAYSGDNVLLGWNVKFYKAGRTLCRVYPRKNSFTILIVIGRQEKEQTEAVLSQMTQEMQKIYHDTQEGMGQRWLVFELKEHNALYEDLLRLIRIRRHIKQK